MKTIKTCPLCKTNHTVESWKGLKYLGTFDGSATDAETVVVELRNCECGDSLCVELRALENNN